MKETYEQLKKRHSDEFNALPMFFAFTEKQFSDGCTKIKYNRETDGKLVEFIDCGFMKRADYEKAKELNAKHEREMNEAMKDEEFVVDAFIYEMRNYEYQYSNDDENIAKNFGLTTKKVGWDNVMDFPKTKDGERLEKCWKKARQKFFKLCEENDWY